MEPAQWQDLKAWQMGLKGPGFLVLGQPLFQADGDWKDHSYSNFRDNYNQLLKIVKASLQGDNDEGRPHDIVVLSGDIHKNAPKRHKDLGGLMEFAASGAARPKLGGGSDNFGRRC